MCGIVGYAGHRPAVDVVVGGLRRLEYRGYDSAGVAVVAPEGLEIRKKAGKLANLEAVLAADPVDAATTGMGHTRWATHGGPTDVNAHPHLSSGGRVAVIHNGIIENFAELTAELGERGVVMASETDTEVVAHLLEWTLEQTGDLADAMRAACHCQSHPRAAWCRGRRSRLVLGDMRELGADAEALHAEAGRRAKAAGIARLYAIGELSAAAARAFGAGARHFDSHEALADALRADLRGDVRILVKGSRGSAMDRVVATLLEGESKHAA